ncbi:hypothetical protein M3Y97_00446400 [Aphelenchoides bicaudatus]|nr:hypothetical protein M3Y97_00446400 [Aphelenchoides bicaudatus]
MSLKHALVLAFLIATVVYACQPDFKAYQLANTLRPCTQCSEILISKGCTSDLHNSSLECITPTVTYALSISEKPCARATITCTSKPGVSQSSAVVAQLNSSVPAFGAISSLQSSNAQLVLKCDSEHQWITQDLDGNYLQQPLTIQCAQSQPDAAANMLFV